MSDYGFMLKTSYSFNEKQAAQIMESSKVGYSSTIILTESEKREIIKNRSKQENTK